MQRTKGQPPGAVLLKLFLIGGLLLQSCSGSRETAPPAPAENQELALQYFLAGSMLDQKGEHAKAVLEYQDALKYKNDPAIHHALSKDYSLLGKHDLAVHHAREAAKLDSQSVRYRQALAEIHLHAGNLDEAIGEFEAIVRIDSSDRVVQMNLARLYQLKSPDRAIEAYRTVIRRFGPEADALGQIARLHSALGNNAGAAEALRELAELEPSNLEARKALGDVYLRQDSVDAALAIFSEIAAVRPDDLEVRAALSHTYLLRQDYERAAAEFESVFTGGDSLAADEQIRFGQVFMSFVQKDSAVVPWAERLFHTIRDRFPDDWRPYWFLGALANGAGNDSAALGYFGRVRELAEWNPDGWIGVASVYYDAGRFDDAVRVLEEAKEFVPDEFRLHFLLGISLQRDGRRAEAAGALERAVELEPDDVDAMSALALVYDELDRRAESDSTYERALRADPDNHLVLNNYGYSLAERGLQLERALGMAEEAVRQQPENQSYLDTYGWVHFQLGNYSEAREWISKAILLGSRSAVIHEHMGDVYFRLSDTGRAMEYWRKALELDPENETLPGKIRRGSL